MSRRCLVSNKAVLYGNLVSHSNRKTRTKFKPNIQPVSLFSSLLKKVFRMIISTHALRTIDMHGGLDSYLLQTRNGKLSPEMLSIKKKLQTNNLSKS